MLSYDALVISTGVVILFVAFHKQVDDSDNIDIFDIRRLAFSGYFSRNNSVFVIAASMNGITSITKIRRQICMCKEVQVGKDQEKAQSEKDSHSKNRGGKKPN